MNFNVKDDRLSRCASEVMEVMKRMQEGFQDIRAYGAPNECGTLVMESVKRELRETLITYGYSAETFTQEVAERTSEYFLYKSCLDIRDIIGGW